MFWDVELMEVLMWIVGLYLLIGFVVFFSLVWIVDKEVPKISDTIELVVLWPAVLFVIVVLSLEK